MLLLSTIILSIVNGFKNISSLEWIGTITGLVEVWLLIRNRIWNWQWGLVSAAVSGVVFHRQHLFSSMWLQFVYFVPMQVYGWWVWKRCGPLKDDDLPINWLSIQMRVVWLIVCAQISLALGFVMSHTTAEMTYWDSTIFGVSIVAQYLQARKTFENWILWIGVDVLCVFVYARQNLYAFAVEYAVFVVMGVVGAIQWISIVRTQEYLESV